MKKPPPPDGIPEPHGAHGLEVVPDCPSCYAVIGELHADWCDIAWCAAVGLQRGGVCDAPHGCRTDPRRDCRTAWTGLYPGLAECRELGWYARLTPKGWVSCDPDAPDAIEDLNRLMTTCIWSPRLGRYVVSAGHETATPGARLRESDEHDEESG